MKNNFLKVAGALTLGFTGYAYLSTKRLTATEYTVSSAKIAPELDGFRVMQLSDIHGSTFGRYNHTLIRKVYELAPDLIVVTGDLLDGDEGINTALTLMRKLMRICPVYYVTGNHEARSANLEDLLPALEKSGIVYLKNQHVYIERDGKTFALVGIDDPSMQIEKFHDYSLEEEIDLEETIVREEIEEATAGIPESIFTFLLAHRPEKWPIYQDTPVDLVCCGHAHGGQVRLPFTEGLFAPHQGLMPKLTAGMHEENDTTMIVSRGIGNATIVPRVFNDPDIPIIRLQHKE
ncbi:metallophosphoesterase [Listeria weihenstephanensis]|uniref:Metallophosphoesterase n=1 Tax=Listeria weihenstephanensis TaxID=1006155 RepID=A0A841Z819_9LIST|nr:metallophosphoesterase [Listeria weihenstephanensis]MBC1500607.1 metallophosphoesterase [Listeria weihenstephanensis]